MPHVKYKFRGSPCGPWPAPTQLVFDECLMPHASNDPKNGSDYTQIIRGEEGEWGLPYGPLSVRCPSKHDQTCGYCMNCLIFLSPQKLFCVYADRTHAPFPMRWASGTDNKKPRKRSFVLAVQAKSMSRSPAHRSKAGYSQSWVLQCSKMQPLLRFFRRLYAALVF